MKSIEKYISFCKKFHEYNLPKLRFKDLNQRNQTLYEIFFKIDDKDINKASFCVFIIFFLVIMIISLIFTPFNLFIISLYSILISLLISYRFNQIIYKEIKSIEKKINALLYLIKIDFSLIYMSLRSNSDYCITLIKLIMDYNIPVSAKFKEAFKKIHEGKNPEGELLTIMTPSKDLDNYLKDLIICNFNQVNKLDDVDLNSAEKNFKIYLKEIKSKISIIFFIGLFFPIGLCFLLMFQQINLAITILLIPFFLLILNFLFKKFMISDIFLIGLLNIHSKNGKKKFNEFLLFLKGFAISLKKNISPEKAFYNTYLENKHNLTLLTKTIRNQISKLINLSYSFKEMIDDFEKELDSIRFSLLLNIIKKMVEESAFYSSEKIFEIISIINKHQKLENKLDIIIKGEKFKLLLFVFLLPLVLGAIGGILPFFTNITAPFNINNDMLQNIYFPFINVNSIYTTEFILIFIVFLSSHMISTIYFLKIVNFENKLLLIFASSVFYVFMFFITFSNFLLFV